MPFLRSMEDFTDGKLTTRRCWCSALRALLISNSEPLLFSDSLTVVTLFNYCQVTIENHSFSSSYHCPELLYSFYVFYRGIITYSDSDSLMSFDKCIYPCNQTSSWKIEYAIILGSSLGSLSILSLPHLSWQPLL